MEAIDLSEFSLVVGYKGGSNRLRMGTYEHVHSTDGLSFFLDEHVVMGTVVF
jgi:hypothetical protein